MATATKKKNQATNTVTTVPKVSYDTNTDYQSLINQAIQSGNSSLARQYEAQRNAKIADMNAQGTNPYNYQQTNYYQPLNLPEYKPYDTSSLPKLTLPEYKPFDYKDFSYNAENDDIYKQYAEQFARQGQAAGENALASTAAATGGMPSSYASAANAQAQQAYAKKTADIIPELEQNAYNRYQNERNFSYQDYLNQYNSDTARAQALYNADWQNTNFSYEDYLNQYNAGVDRAKTAYDSETALRDFNYQNYLNQLDNAYRQSTFDWQKQTDTRDFNYQSALDTRNFDYQKSQDAIQNALSQSSNSRAWAQFDYNKTQDELDRQEREKERQYEKYQANLEANYPNTVMGQLESRTAAAQAAEKENNIKAAISSALNAEDPAQWLRENVQYLSTEEYQAVVDALKSYSNLNK